MKTKEVVKPEHFKARFVEEWKVLEKMLRGQKGMNKRVVNSGNLARPVCS